MQDEPGRISGRVFIVNDRTFISPYGDDTALHYRVSHGKSPKRNDIFHVIEFYFYGVPNSDFFDF